MKITLSGLLHFRCFYCMYGKFVLQSRYKSRFLMFFMSKVSVMFITIKIRFVNSERKMVMPMGVLMYSGLFVLLGN